MPIDMMRKRERVKAAAPGATKKLPKEEKAEEKLSSEKATAGKAAPAKKAAAKKPAAKKKK